MRWVLLLTLVSCGPQPVIVVDAGDAGDAGDGATNDAASDTALPDTWITYAQGFFGNYCISCHNSGDATGRDYSIQANVVKDKLPMRCGVCVTQDATWNCAASPVAKQFPIGSGPKPTDAERTRIVAWITAGAP
jgi:hypothetical protein